MNSSQHQEYKVGPGAYFALAFAAVFFSGLLGGKEWYGVFDFTTLNGAFGKVVSKASLNDGTLTTATSAFRGTGGSGNLADEGQISETEKDVFAMFQFSAGAMITNFFSSGAILFTLVAVDGTAAVPASIGACIAVMFIMKIVGANLLRLILTFTGKNTAESPQAKGEAA